MVPQHNKHEVLTASEPNWFPDEQSGEQYAKLFAKETKLEMSLVVHCMTRLVYEYGKNEDNSFHEPIGILSGTGDETEGTLVGLKLDRDDDDISADDGRSVPLSVRSALPVAAPADSAGMLGAADAPSAASAAAAAGARQRRIAADVAHSRRAGIVAAMAVAASSY